MSAQRRWRRIEPGYYKLEGTDIEIFNMRGQSVQTMGTGGTFPWKVYVGHHTVSEARSMVEAKAKGVELADDPEKVQTVLDAVERSRQRYRERRGV